MHLRDFPAPFTFHLCFRVISFTEQRERERNTFFIINVEKALNKSSKPCGMERKFVTMAERRSLKCCVRALNAVKKL